MKSLTILRHAKSGWDAPVERDFDRPINVRGRCGAELMGDYWKKSGWPLDWIIASPAVRVTETLDHFQPAAGLADMEPHWERRVYLASAATLLDVVREAGALGDHLMLVGHNPGLEDLAMMLVPFDPANKGRVALEEKLPTASLVRITFNIAAWADLSERSGTLDTFVRPRDLDPALVRRWIRAVSDLAAPDQPL
ncbi:MAG: histidine phosphatase family protein [Nitrospiraceae bacterium]|nr:histidine phosphatase family protein [Nitrospiraceae bacterium]